jgi:peptide deformylase
MALLKILHVPDPRLREKAWPIENIDDEIHQLIEDMFETMYDAPGVGLAATQVGIAKRLAVIDVSQEKNQRLVLINPEILEKRDEEIMEEGCLSVPYHADKVKRATWVKMRALDQKGKVYELESTGLLAECIQHEIDHLDGKLYIDYLSSLKRNRIVEKIKKIKRERKDL